MHNECPEDHQRSHLALCIECEGEHLPQAVSAVHSDHSSNVIAANDGLPSDSSSSEKALHKALRTRPGASFTTLDPNKRTEHSLR
jgi:hypothetical protein